MFLLGYQFRTNFLLGGESVERGQILQQLYPVVVERPLPVPKSLRMFRDIQRYSAARVVWFLEACIPRPTRGTLDGFKQLIERFWERSFCM